METFHSVMSEKGLGKRSNAEVEPASGSRISQPADIHDATSLQSAEPPKSKKKDFLLTAAPGLIGDVSMLKKLNFKPRRRLSTVESEIAAREFGASPYDKAEPSEGKDSDEHEVTMYRRRESSYTDALDDPLKFHDIVKRHLDEGRTGKEAEMKKDLTIAGYEARMNRVKDREGRYRRMRLGSATHLKEPGNAMLGEIEEEQVRPRDGPQRKISNEKEELTANISSCFQ